MDKRASPTVPDTAQLDCLGRVGVAQNDLDPPGLAIDAGAAVPQERTQ